MLEVINKETETSQEDDIRKRTYTVEEIQAYIIHGTTMKKAESRIVTVF